MSTNNSRQPPLSVRLDPELSQWVKEQAKAGDRSINAEINRLVRQVKEARKAELKQVSNA